MNINEFIMAMMQNKAYETTSIMHSIFVINLPVTEEQYLKYPDYRVYVFNDKYMTNINGAPVEITSKNKVDQPLVREGDIMNTVNILNIPDGTSLPVGRLLKYMVINVSCFEGKIPYTDKMMTVRDYDEYILGGLNSYLKVYARGVKYLVSLSTIINVSATPATIQRPKGIKEFVKKTKKDFDLTDPLAIVAFDNKVKEFAMDALKDDPSFGKTLNKKTLGRFMKLYGTYGSEEAFGGHSAYIDKSLSEGLPTDAEAMAGWLNASRAGSLDRGNNTQIGGVIFNLLSVVVSGLHVVEGKCDTKDMLTVTVQTKADLEDVSTRYTLVGGKSVKVKPKGFGVYKIRSPLYCITEGRGYCQHCAGERLFDIPDGIVQAGSEVSRVIIAFYMKAMHGRELETIELPSITALF